MVLTILPVADEKYRDEVCMPQSNETTALDIGRRVLKLVSGMGLSINGKHVYCGDYIYSGHTMTIIMACLIIKEYSPRRWVLLHYASMAIGIAGVVTLLIARGHYSIDVVIAYWITTRIWWIFHTLANNPNLKEVNGFGRNENNYLKNLWWWYIFRYFECNVPICLPRRFNCPVPNALLKSKCVQHIFSKLQMDKRRNTKNSTSTPGDNDLSVPNSSENSKYPNDFTKMGSLST